MLTGQDEASVRQRGGKDGARPGRAGPGIAEAPSEKGSLPQRLTRARSQSIARRALAP